MTICQPTGLLHTKHIIFLQLSNCMTVASGHHISSSMHLSKCRLRIIRLHRFVCICRLSNRKRDKAMGHPAL
uniref:Uncharacterized protein n=1 Tax=Pararge aegeria TaxID=116150 RepID=S4NTR7_9NEOP